MSSLTNILITLLSCLVVWFVVDRLTKLAHFIPIRTDYSLDKLVELYIAEIVK